ncbi:uncharacterized protein RSE6_02213 [Rhynchosporium secalis]|uniref:Uncharacterized protein n=1 Tax=Rhynchosporium secalis TaxID=38038 RepID=A0A1E1M1B3_RHYSE|nr:uncharacterized protein RSE6_02213 [Rhynchosporium secalis]
MTNLQMHQTKTELTINILVTVDHAPNVCSGGIAQGDRTVSGRRLRVIEACIQAHLAFGTVVARTTRADLPRCFMRISTVDSQNRRGIRDRHDFQPIVLLMTSDLGCPRQSVRQSVSQSVMEDVGTPAKCSCPLIQTEYLMRQCSAVQQIRLPCTTVPTSRSSRKTLEGPVPASDVQPDCHIKDKNPHAFLHTSQRQEDHAAQQTARNDWLLSRIQIRNLLVEVRVSITPPPPPEKVKELKLVSIEISENINTINLLKYYSNIIRKLNLLRTEVNSYSRYSKLYLSTALTLINPIGILSILNKSTTI